MRYVMINGGLGNQLFQYIFFRYIEEMTGDECVLDDSEFAASNYHNGYEIERIFGLKPKRLSKLMPPDEWSRFVEQNNIKQAITSPGILSEKTPLSVIQEGPLFQQATATYAKQFDRTIYNAALNGYTPQVKDIEGNVYYYGYWINAHWFYFIREQVLKELQFPPMTDEFNINMREQICSSESVAVHIRRGDFVELGKDMENRYYQVKIDAMKNCVRNPKFFVFSDDLKWCIENSEDIGFNKGDKVVYVDGNKGLNSFRDMQLMTYCRNMVITQSSFSYLAALLNQNPNKYIIQPTTRDII
jgi:hypothetical protein